MTRRAMPDSVLDMIMIIGVIFVVIAVGFTVISSVRARKKGSSTLKSGNKSGRNTPSTPKRSNHNKK